MWKWEEGRERGRMLQGERLRASGVAVAVPLLALAALAALAYSGRPSSHTQLDQVGENEFLDPTKTETATDMALKIQGILVRVRVCACPCLCMRVTGRLASFPTQTPCMPFLYSVQPYLRLC